MKKLFLSICLLAGVTMFAQDKVSDAELNSFTEIYKVMLTENQKAQNSIFAMIEEEGLEINRFAEIEAAVNQNSTEGEKPSEKELAIHKKIHDNIAKIQTDFEATIEKEIEKQGMTKEQYERVANTISTDQELQQKLQEKMMGGLE
ncbi:MAG TPA: DUF4168 domain-containing protein [Flavobacteriaceae bacterium]|nr:DUF4168 domain-containing protein [Flavobacteriaceae bacterium]